MLLIWSAIHLIPTDGCDRNLAGTSWKGAEYHLYLIKIPSHISVESIYEYSIGPGIIMSSRKPTKSEGANL